jgi:hypothetical protein
MIVVNGTLTLNGNTIHVKAPSPTAVLAPANYILFKKAGEILGETDQKLWRALFAHVAAAWADLSWENVTWVGADEMNRKKGHNYLTVFADLQAKRVLLAVEGKDASVWERFAAELGKHNGHPRAITQIAIDMSPAYKKGVRENFGNATVVFDKFHVVSQVVQAVDEVRRLEARADAPAREQLTRTSWSRRKNPEGRTEKEQAHWEQLQARPLVTELGVCDGRRATYNRRAPPPLRPRRGIDLKTGATGSGARPRHGRQERVVGSPRGQEPAGMVERHLDGIPAACTGNKLA